MTITSTNVTVDDIADMDIPDGPYTPDKLNIIAARCLVGIRFASPQLDPPAEQRSQAFAMCEEIGEVLSAYRRWSGMARRAGTIEDLAEELADVRLTGYVAAHAYEIPVATVLLAHQQIGLDRAGPVGFWGRGQQRRPGPAEQIMQMQVIAGLIATNYVDERPFPDHQRSVGYGLACAIQDAIYTAEHLGIDLDAATDIKVEKVFTRGFRDPR